MQYARIRSEMAFTGVFILDVHFIVESVKTAIRSNLGQITLFQLIVYYCAGNCAAFCCFDLVYLLMFPALIGSAAGMQNVYRYAIYSLNNSG